jgi:hypothetical protein
LSGTGGVAVTPELVLVDPELAKAQRQTTERKAAMSSTEPSNGAFFVDPAQPVPPPATPEVAPVPAPAPQPEPAAAVPAAMTPAAAVHSHVAATTPMVDVPLGTLIFRAGLLAEEQLEDALQEGMRTGKRLGEVLIERGWLHERDLGRLLAGQKGLPFVEVNASDAEPEALRIIPEEKARLQVALPLRHEDGQLVVAVADPSNELVVENLRRTIGSEPRLVVAPQGDLLRAIGEAYAALSAAVPEPAPQPQPELSVEAQPESQLTPIREPDAVQPLSPPAVTALPTVLPPAEERVTEPVTTPLVQPLATEQLPVVEPPAPPAPETVAPLLDQPVSQPEPVVPAAPAAPPAPEIQVAEPQPMPAPMPEPVLQPPVAPPPAAEVPAEPPVSASAPVEPQAPAPAQVAPTSIHAVVLRLREGDTLEIGTFHTAAEAATRAQEVVAEIAAAEANATWPLFAQRYLRPDTIVSVDMLAETSDKWLGSSLRARWGAES